MKPISSNERVQLLDVLRGFAIFGMFTVNMTADIWWGDTFRETDLALPDFVALVLVDLLPMENLLPFFHSCLALGFSYSWSESIHVVSMPQLSTSEDQPVY